MSIGFMGNDVKMPDKMDSRGGSRIIGMLEQV